MMLRTTSSSTSAASRARPQAARRPAVLAEASPAMRVFNNPLYNPKAAKAQGHAMPKTAKSGQTTASDIHFACKEVA